MVIIFILIKYPATLRLDLFLTGSITNPLSFLVVRIVTVVLLRIVKGLATRQPDTMTVVKRELDHVSGGGATDPDDPKSKNHVRPFMKYKLASCFCLNFSIARPMGIWLVAGMAMVTDDP